VCRKSGLEARRRCGWLNQPDDGTGSLVWARKRVSLRTCPRSYISAESQVLLEEFLVRRRLGAIDLADLSAKQVEAFVVLEKALVAERNDGEHHTR
jgi:hypothetical protein